MDDKVHALFVCSCVVPGSPEVHPSVGTPRDPRAPVAGCK